jgi:methyltransferase (TIGR00027 family)
VSEPAIRDVSDTARWVAIYRAMESERPDALFRDPYARQLGGERGEEIVRRLPRGAATAWPMIVRTAVFDEIITRHVDPAGAAPADTVLNLAAGLDARPYRLALPPALRWIEVDLPAVLAYKEERLAAERAACVVERVPLDLADTAARRALFARVGAEARRVFVLTEGLLVYLPPESVASLAADLAAPASFRWWQTDLASPRLLRMLAKSWGKDLDAAKAPFRFAPAEGPEFFAPFGWRVAETRSTWEEARRLRRQPRGAWVYQLLTRLSPPKKREEIRRMSLYVLLENRRAEPA